MKNSQVVKNYRKMFAKKTVKQSKQDFRLMFKLIWDKIAQWHEVKITGFWTFLFRSSPERKWYNPKSNEYITIPSLKRIKFLPSTLLKKKINEKR